MTTAVATLVAGAMVAPLPASGATDAVVANWQMNEPPGASVMTDSSGNGLHGQIGELVETGAPFAGATGYRWSHTLPNQPPPEPERLVRIDDDEDLNPAARDFAVVVRFRTTESFGNIVQKGQATTPTASSRSRSPTAG